MHGISPRLPIKIKLEPDAFPDVSEGDKQIITAGMSQRATAMNAAHGQLVANVEKAQERQTKDYAKRRRTNTSMPPVGSFVWIRNERKGDGEASAATSKKKDLGQDKWIGPFKLTGYSADNSRAIIETASTASTPAKSWTESWKDIATKEQLQKRLAKVQAKEQAKEETR
jgi:hypothetical protein